MLIIKFDHQIRTKLLFKNITVTPPRAGGTVLDKALTVLMAYYLKLFYFFLGCYDP